MNKSVLVNVKDHVILCPHINMVQKQFKDRMLAKCVLQERIECAEAQIAELKIAISDMEKLLKI